uniref:GPS domain-containing protein n=1 Tax=Macrostomum lignano TaxID=282301 RepID=A0A1I8FDU7_9PLAT
PTCPPGSYPRLINTPVELPPSARRYICLPLAEVGGEECRKLAKAALSVYQTEKGSCAELKSCNSTSVRAQLLTKFADTQIFDSLDAVTGFARVLSEQLPVGLNPSKPVSAAEQRNTVSDLLSSVSAFAPLDLWAAESTTTNPSAGGGRRSSEEAQRGLTTAADTVLRAIDSLGLGLQAAAAPAEAVYNSSGIGLSVLRLSSSAGFTAPGPGVSVKVRYSGSLASVAMVTSSVDLPHLIRWLRPAASDQQVVSQIVQASLFSAGGKLQSGGSALFLVRMPPRQMRRVRRSCVFVDSNGRLSDTGCSVVAELSDQSRTACLCSHLTSFAVVASPGSSWQTVESRQLLTYICLSLSIVCLIVTCLAYLPLRLKSPNAESTIVTLHRVHRALCATLIVAQLLFLVGYERVEFGFLPCQILSGLTVYSFLSSLLVVLPGANSALAKLKFWHYCLLSYLAPAIIVAIAAAVRRDQLIQTEADLSADSDTLERPSTCWLSETYGTRWAFLGPMLAVCAINLVLFICHPSQD